MIRFTQYSLVVITALAVLYLGVQRPFYNWDMIPYVAASYKLEGLTKPEVSAYTYQEIEKKVGPEQFKRLVAGSYRQTLFQDPESLAQTLPNYTSRVAYIGLMTVLHKLGLDYVTATHVISAFFAGASVFLVALLCQQLGLSLFWVPFIALFCGYNMVARFSTPDAIACFFSLLAAMLILNRNRLVYLVIVLLPLFRTDFIIFSLLVSAYTFLKGERTASLISAIAALIVYTIVNKLTGYYGYITIYNFAFIDRTPYPGDMVNSTDLLLYLKSYLDAVYRLGLSELLGSKHILIYFFAFITLGLSWRQKVLADEQQALLLIVILFLLARFMLLPMYVDRYYVFPATILFIMTLVYLKKCRPQTVQRN